MSGSLLGTSTSDGSTSEGSTEGILNDDIKPRLFINTATIVLGDHDFKSFIVGHIGSYQDMVSGGYCVPLMF